MPQARLATRTENAREAANYASGGETTMQVWTRQGSGRDKSDGRLRRVSTTDAADDLRLEGDGRGRSVVLEVTGVGEEDGATLVDGGELGPDAIVGRVVARDDHEHNEGLDDGRRGVADELACV